jgi:hypothetical protein
MSSKLIVRLSAAILALAIVVAGFSAYAFAGARPAGVAAQSAALQETYTAEVTTTAEPTGEPTAEPTVEPTPTITAPSQQYLVGEIWARTELYFGTNTPDGVISDEEFAAFVNDVVTPRFPDGLTLLTGDGQFRNSAGEIIKERSKVLIVLYPLTDTDANREIEEIREAYKAQFEQESVLRVDSLSGVSF